MKKDGFLLRESQGIRYYSCRALEGIARLCHGFSTRSGGVPGPAESSLNLGYSSWDSKERITENRRRFLSALNLEDSRLATLRQVHSNRVYIIEDNFTEGNQSEGDAFATGVKNIALAVQIADCLPILVADPANRAIASVHSGWRGTLSRVLLQTVLEMERAFGSRPSDLITAVGPGIRACCFEVEAEVAERFEREYPGSRIVKPAAPHTGKYLVDLIEALDIQLSLAGVQEENRYDLGACTRCNTDMFFSYRAEGTASGRMMAVIGWR
jgi:polyphenol oxidase